MWPTQFPWALKMVSRRTWLAFTSTTGNPVLSEQVVLCYLNPAGTLHISVESSPVTISNSESSPRHDDVSPLPWS